MIEIEVTRLYDETYSNIASILNADCGNRRLVSWDIQHDYGKNLDGSINTKDRKAFLVATYQSIPETTPKQSIFAQQDVLG